MSDMESTVDLTGYVKTEDLNEYAKTVDVKPLYLSITQRGSDYIFDNTDYAGMDRFNGKILRLDRKILESGRKIIIRAQGLDLRNPFRFQVECWDHPKRHGCDVRLFKIQETASGWMVPEKSPEIFIRDIKEPFGSGIIEYMLMCRNYEPKALYEQSFGDLIFSLEFYRIVPERTTATYADSYIVKY